LTVNIPAQLVSTLGGFGIEADTAAARRWKELTNRRLIEAAHQAGLSAILTRDRRFGIRMSQSELVLITAPPTG